MSRSRWIALLIVCLALCAAPSAASGAIVTNGDFETGNLSGWTLDNLPDDMTSGSWFAYTGTTPPISGMLPGASLSAPPQGNFAAITDQEGPGRRILYQDVVVPPSGPQYLTLYAYYRTSAQIASPDSLDPAGMFDNQQYRIDVMRPSAPIDSVASSDILTTVFRTVNGDPESLSPSLRLADLTPFAGQTVRLRFAEVDNRGVFNAGTDAVSVDSDLITLGTPQRNKKKGTALLPVDVRFPGTLSLTGNGVAQVSAASKSVAVQAGTTTLLVKATGKKRRKLNRKGKLQVNVTVTYIPAGATTPSSETAQIKLKKKRKKK
jgi:hypothetical protein